MSKRPWFKCYPSDFLNGVSSLLPNELAVYTVCLMRMYDEGGAIPDEPERIARRCNMRPTSCAKALDELCQIGKLARRDGMLVNDRAEKVIETRQKVSTKSATSAHTRWEKVREKLNENKDGAMRPICGTDADAMPTRSQKPDTRKKEPPNPPEGGEVDFEIWYTAYPRHIAPGAAEKAYRKARKIADAETLLVGIEVYRRTKPDYADWKHPATWLNGKCWLDESGRNAANGADEPYLAEFQDDLRRDYVKLRDFLACGLWMEDWGPKPGEPDCLIAAEVMAKYGSPPP